VSQVHLTPGHDPAVLLGHGTAPRPADPAGYREVEAQVAAAVDGLGC